jgi:hypothetical protein
LILGEGVTVTPFLRLAGVASALALVAATTAPSPVASLLEDPAAARAFDYAALRERLGDEQIVVLSKALDETFAARLVATPGACETEAEAFVRQGLASALQAPDADAWRADWKAANARRDQIYARVAKVLNGEDVGGTLYDGVRADAKAAVAASDPRHRELFARVARDQAWRHTFHDIEAMPQGPVREMVRRPLSAKLCAVDAENDAWLKAEWRTSGWFTAARDGEVASQRAWLILQHADSDPDFQRAVLPILAQETSLQARLNYAQLTDRVASNAQQPQTFGTQGRCVAPGRWEPLPVKDPEGLDARRAALTLPPEAEYQAFFAAPCANFKAP